MYEFNGNLGDLGNPQGFGMYPKGKRGKWRHLNQKIRKCIRQKKCDASIVPALQQRIARMQANLAKLPTRIANHQKRLANVQAAIQASKGPPRKR
jgi:septal ring factor EnvC (AmiA/AmiB activator)